MKIKFILFLLIIGMGAISITYCSQLNKVKDELAIAQEKLVDGVEESIGLSISLDNISEELKNANIVIEDLKDEKYELIYLGDFKLTHYCTELYSHICGTGTGLTATGTTATPGRTIAIDPTVIPYGSEVYIEGYGWRVAEDCGGAVKNKQIDIAVDTHSEALELGINYGGVWLLKKSS